MPGRGAEGVVRRGFDYEEWLRAGGRGPQGQWNANDIEHLVLVVHGIGQKLSERVETFDFTYAINTFRVLMAKQHELLSTTHSPAAVLPINWRRKINFDYDDATSSGQSEENREAPIHRAFALSDITPNTIPTVRNIISDVLLDIPYYLSKHRSRVLHAVAAEANRIYRLWMRNNPGWQGKISIIGHSLGSVIAVDILSRQPTVPPPLGSQNENLSEEDELLLEFPVRNLFLAGSPVGFFLLLNRTNLMPRIMSKTRLASIVRNIPNTDDLDDEHDPGDLEPEKIGINHGGVYGCLAVDNIYNVIHTSDPIAYSLNPCVDPEYAAKLRRAILSVPIIRRGIFRKFFSLRNKNPDNSLQLCASETKQRVVDSARSTGAKVATIAVHYSFTRRPSSSSRIPQTELETRDFKYEKIVQTRMHCLNENGQIDFVVQPTGALENQYISILTAHSGYWESKEFAYLVALECSRQEGVENTFKSFRAVRK
ncbi:DDHD domain-containing protein [Lipomyces chichibuensis]|uniref:DDHD domain-containing protein n=1 Tax=Lipomyces chichibuensis TaxID=1546026 RepID=UPI00334335DB